MGVSQQSLLEELKKRIVGRIEVSEYEFKDVLRNMEEDNIISVLGNVKRQFIRYIEQERAAY